MFSISPYYRGIPFGKEFKGSDAFIIIGGFDLSEVVDVGGDLHLGIAYDLTISELADAVGGTFEFSMQYAFNKVQRVKKKKWAPVPCPTF
jgi:hypothetical protein